MTVIVTMDKLRIACPYTKAATLEPLVDPMNEAMERFEISMSTPRVVQFGAQMAHETMDFRYLKEIASGEAYEGRKDLGNWQPGWGMLYPGRGLPHLTGEANYKLAGTELYGDPDWYTYNPQFVEEPKDACLVGAWYWAKHGLNELADRQTDEGFREITKRINGACTDGAPSHYKDRLIRLALWRRAFS